MFRPPRERRRRRARAQRLGNLLADAVLAEVRAQGLVIPTPEQIAREQGHLRGRLARAGILPDSDEVPPEYAERLSAGERDVWREAYAAGLKGEPHQTDLMIERQRQPSGKLAGQGGHEPRHEPASPGGSGGGAAARDAGPDAAQGEDAAGGPLGREAPPDVERR